MVGPSWALLVALLIAHPAHADPAASQLVAAIQIIAPADLFSARVHTLWGVQKAPDRLIEVIGAEIARHAPMALVSAAELGLDPYELERCNEAGSLACWLRASQRHVEGGPGLARRTPSFILVVSVRPTKDERADVTAMLIPLSRDRQQQVSRVSGRDEALEDAIFQESVALDGEVVVDNLGSWRALAASFGTKLAGRIHAPPGSVSIVASRPGLEVVLDNVDQGTLGADGKVELRFVPIGRHSLALIDPRDRFVHDPVIVDVETATVTVVDAILRERSSTVSTWGGLGLAAAGAALVVYGLAAPRNTDICLAACGRPRFVTFGEGGGQRSSVMIVPLGYSLALAGATWAASPDLFDDWSTYPWLQLGLGLAVGAASYAISAAAGG